MRRYDAVVVGARCSGASLAMLLARLGYRVLAIDRARFPSDTISTHLVWPPGVAAIHRWGLWERVAALDPATPHFTWARFPGGSLRSPWHAVDGVDYALSIRRIKLDAVFIRAAREAGADVWEGTSAQQLVFEDDRVVGVRGRHLGLKGSFEVHGDIVVGADGRQSMVARQVRAVTYNEVESLTGSYYTYVRESELNRDVAELLTVPPRELLFVPTDDSLTMVNVVIARRLLPEFRRDVESNFYNAFEVAPEWASRLRMAERVSPVRGMAYLPNFYRKPYGPGWVLVGDAGLHKDPIRAQGIHDAFLDAESMANALHAAWSGVTTLEKALRDHHERRDRRVDYPYEACIRAARFTPPSRELLEDLLPLLQSSSAMAAEYRGLMAGSMRPEVFFEPAHFLSLLTTGSCI